MSLENYEGTAIDTSNFVEPDPIEVQPAAEETQTGVVETVETNTETPVVETTETSTQTDRFNIPGLGEFTADEIKEWKNGSLRQADYTKKTQELARQREENQAAQELFQYLQANPALVEAMRQAEQNPNSVVFKNAPTAESQMIRDIAYKQREIETDMKLAQLRQTYGDINEVALLNKAAELRTDDLEFVYKALSYDNNNIDKQALINEAKEQLKAELLANKDAVGTTVTTTQTAPVQNQRTLTADEKRVAAGMGMSEADYLKWMN
jgi:hypothetical protein